MKISVELTGFQYELLKQIARQEGSTVPVVVRTMVVMGTVDNNAVRKQIRKDKQGKAAAKWGSTLGD